MSVKFKNSTANEMVVYESGGRIIVKQSSGENVTQCGKGPVPMLVNKLTLHVNNQFKASISYAGNDDEAMQHHIDKLLRCIK